MAEHLAESTRGPISAAESITCSTDQQREAHRHHYRPSSGMPAAPPQRPEAKVPAEFAWLSSVCRKAFLVRCTERLLTVSDRASVHSTWKFGLPADRLLSEKPAAHRQLPAEPMMPTP